MSTAIRDPDIRKIFPAGSRPCGFFHAFGLFFQQRLQVRGFPAYRVLGGSISVGGLRRAAGPPAGLPVAFGFGLWALKGYERGWVVGNVQAGGSGLWTLSDYERGRGGGRPAWLFRAFGFGAVGPPAGLSKGCEKGWVVGLAVGNVQAGGSGLFRRRVWAGRGGLLRRGPIQRTKTAAFKDRMKAMR